MRVQTFNRESIINKKRRQALQHQEPAQGPREHIDTLGLLDPGFEDVGIKVHDYDIAPGLTAHFATMDEPPPNYFAMPALERRSHD